MDKEWKWVGLSDLEASNLVVVVEVVRDIGEHMIICERAEDDD